MTGRASCRLRAAAAALLAGAGTAGAQLLTPNDTIAVPPVGHTRVELVSSLYSVDSFVDLDGNAQRFPGSLDFALAVVRASYSPWRHVAFGIEQPYRRSTFNEPGIEATFVAKGIPGVGFFVDWAPGEQRADRWRPTLRLEWFRARDENDRPLTISDGANRASVALALAGPVGSSPGAWRREATFQLLYGPRLEGEHRYVEARVQLAAGRPVLRIMRSDLCAFGIVGYRSSTSARQEGMFFHDRTSQGAFAGARLDWQPAKAGVPEIRLSAVEDVRARNALSGWRATLSLVGTF